MLKYINAVKSTFLNNEITKRGKNKLEVYNEKKQVSAERKVGQPFHKKYNPNNKSILIENGKYIDIETGENLTHLYQLTYKTSEEQSKSYLFKNSLNVHDQQNGKHILLLFRRLVTMEEQYPTLTKPDVARLLYLLTFIKYESNRLQSDNGRQHYTKKYLEGMLEMSTKRFNEYFKRLENEGIIRETETGELFINPTVAYYGHKSTIKQDIKDLHHTRLFKNTVRDLYEKFKGRRLGQLSVIYSVLPFLNFKSNVICHNPDETSDRLIKPMELAELAELLKYSDKAKLKATLNRIKINGQPVFGFFENPHDRRSFRIVVNPSVVFAGDGEALEAIKVLFN